MIKYCTKCQQDAEFTPKGKRCQACNREYQRQHYLAHKETYLDKAYARRDMMKQFVWGILCQSQCVDCSEADPIVLEFDHVRGVKLGNVMNMAQDQAAKSKIQSEIDKCEIVCANCHKKRTYGRCDSYRLRAPMV